jgi:hypothetical protein
VGTFGVGWPSEWFTIEEFFKRFALRHQILVLIFFYACFDFGDYFYGVWLES